tara:strand:- start:46 stop:294 length:249 start_codon:yes stop_codon:yes gene_type:complete
MSHKNKVKIYQNSSLKLKQETNLIILQQDYKEILELFQLFHHVYHLLNNYYNYFQKKIIQNKRFIYNTNKRLNYNINKSFKN